MRFLIYIIFIIFIFLALCWVWSRSIVCELEWSGLAECALCWRPGIRIRSWLGCFTALNVQQIEYPMWEQWDVIGGKVMRIINHWQHNSIADNDESCYIVSPSVAYILWNSFTRESSIRTRYWSCKQCMVQNSRKHNDNSWMPVKTMLQNIVNYDKIMVYNKNNFKKNNENNDCIQEKWKKWRMSIGKWWEIMKYKIHI
jgi:hypothetical protein